MDISVYMYIQAACPDPLLRQHHELVIQASRNSTHALPPEIPVGFSKQDSHRHHRQFGPTDIPFLGSVPTT